MAQQTKFSLRMLIDADGNPAIRVLNSVRAAIKGLGDGAASVGAAFGPLTAKIAGIGAAVGGYFSGRAVAGWFSSAVQSAGELERSLSILQQTSGASADELALLKAAAEAVADSPLPYTAAQAAEGQIELARAGQSAQQVIASLPPVLNLAASAQLAVGESAGIVTSQLGAFGLAAEQSARVADTLAAGANVSNTSVRGLAEALAYAGPMAKAAGLDIEGVAAAVGLMANAGIDGSRAGTALNSILSQLQDPASKASGALSAMGVTSRDLSTVLTALAADTPQAERAILAFGQEAGPGLRALVAAGGAGLDALRTKIVGMGGEAQRSAEAMQNNLFGAFEELASLWESIKTKVGESLLGPLTEEIRRVSGDLRGWVASGQLEQFRVAVVSAFLAAAGAAREFVAGIDFGALVQRIADFAQSTGQSLDTWGQRLAAVGDAAGRVAAGISLAFNGVVGAVNTVGQAFSGMVAGVLEAYATVAEGARQWGLASEQEALRARAAADTAAEAMQQYADTASGHYQRAGQAWDAMVGNQEAGADRLADASQQAAQAAKTQADAVGLTADQLDALGASAGYAAEGQQALTVATQAGAQASAADAQAKTDSAAATRDDAQAKTGAAAAAREEANARQIGIAAAQLELSTRTRAVDLIAAEGDARLVHLRNLHEEAMARGDAAEVARLADEIASAGIAVAEEAVAAKRAEADAALALARALEEQAAAEDDASAETQEAVIAAKQAAQAKLLQAEAAAEAVRHEKALADAAASVAEATERAADAAVRDADERARAADEQARIDAANKKAGAQAWAQYWNAQGIADEFTKRAQGSAQSREKLLADALFRITSTSSSFGGTAYSAKSGEFIAKKLAEVQAIWAAQDAQKASTRVAGSTVAAVPAAVQPVAAKPATLATTINIAGVLDVNDRATLDSLARKLQPILADLMRRGGAAA